VLVVAASAASVLAAAAAALESVVARSLPDSTASETR
jgi:hypothetical protein